VLEDFILDTIRDRLEGWELVDFLQIPIEEVLNAAIDLDWINEDNIEDLLDLVGLKA
jgi:hypothetical protein